MDLIAELRTQIWHLLTQDEALKAICKNTVRLYNTWADKDSPMPYLVHRMQEKPLPDGVITDLDYYLDIWDYDSSIGRALEIRGRVVALLDRQILTMPSGATARFFYASGGDIPEDTAGIQHYATQWRVRVGRTVDIEQRSD